VTALLENLSPFLCLHCFGSISKGLLQFLPNIPGTHPIILEYSQMLFTSYYSQNYATIIDAGLMLEGFVLHL